MVLEFRVDPTKNVVVLVSSKRAKRPTSFGKRVECPFCKGSEHVTPPTKFALPSEKEWRVRVFDNLFHLVAPGKWKGQIDGAPAVGTHEVIVETDGHEQLWHELEDAQLERVFEAYKDRLAVLAKKREAKYVFLFKNHGRNGGASIEHEHAQIVSFPFLPEVIEREVQNSNAYRKKRHACLYCQLLKKEKKNILVENEFFAALCPRFSRFPFEVWVLPKQHRTSMTGFSEKESRQFMQLLKECVRRAYFVAKDYNIAFHESPKNADLHFHAELYPRTGHWAGVELGTGIIVNTKGEQEALKTLRRINHHDAKKK